MIAANSYIVGALKLVVPAAVQVAFSVAPCAPTNDWRTSEHRGTGTDAAA